MSTPEGDRQPSQHGILFFPDKSFVSSHMKFQNFPAERSLSPYWENLVFGALVDEVWWAPPSHIRCRLWKRQVPSYQLPVTWLCSLVQIVEGQNMEKNPIFWKLGIVFWIAHPKHECYGPDSLQVHHVSRQSLFSLRLLVCTLPTSRQDNGNLKKKSIEIQKP